MRWRTYFVPCVALGLIVLGIMPWGTTAKQSTPNKENALAGQDGKESVRLTGHMLVGSKRICTFRFSAEFFWQRSKTIAVGEVAEFRAEDKEVATWPGVPGKMAVIKVVKEFTDSKAKEVQVATRFLELYSWEAPYTGPMKPIYTLARGDCLLICRGTYTDAAIKLPGNWEQTSLVRSLERIAAVRNSPKKGPGLQAGALGEDDRTACYCLYRLLADPTMAGGQQMVARLRQIREDKGFSFERRLNSGGLAAKLQPAPAGPLDDIEWIMRAVQDEEVLADRFYGKALVVQLQNDMKLLPKETRAIKRKEAANAFRRVWEMRLTHNVSEWVFDGMGSVFTNGKPRYMGEEPETIGGRSAAAPEGPADETSELVFQFFLSALKEPSKDTRLDAARTLAWLPHCISSPNKSAYVLRARAALQEALKEESDTRTYADMRNALEAYLSRPPAPVQAEAPIRIAEATSRLDFWGHPLPAGALARAGTSRFRAPLGFSKLAFLPDDITLWAWNVLPTGRQALHAWQYPRGKELDPAGSKELSSVDFRLFLPDGTSFVAVEGSGDILIRDSATGKELRRLRGHDQLPVEVGISRDGSRLLSAGRDGMARIWDMALGKEIRRFPLDEGKFSWFYVSPQANYWATVGQDNSVKVWEAENGKKVCTITSPNNAHCIWTFSPDGRTFASYGSPDPVSLWEIPSGRLLQRLDSAITLAFSPDSRFLATAVNDRTISVWSVANRQVVRTFPCHALAHGSASISFAFSRDGRILAICGTDTTVHFLDLADGKEVSPLQGHTRPVRATVFSPDGMSLATAGDDNTIRIWHAKTGEPIRQITGRSSWTRIMYLDSDRIAGYSREDGLVHIYDASTGREVEAVKLGLDGAEAVLFLPGGQTVAAANREQVTLMHLAGGRERRRWSYFLGDSDISVIKGVAGTSQKMAISPNGRLLALGSRDGLIHLWDVQAGHKIRQLRGHHSPVQAVAFSPDGRLLASCGGAVVDSLSSLLADQARGPLRAERAAKGQSQGSKDVPGAPRRNGVDLEIRIWEVGTGKQVLELKGQKDIVSALVFSPDGRLLASGSRDGAIVIWDVGDGRPLMRFTDDDVPVNSVMFSPDGGLLASGMENGLAYTWDMSSVRSQPRQRGLAQEADTLWTDLASLDAAKAYRAVQRLSTLPAQAVSIFKEHLRSVPLETPEPIRKSIADLDSDRFSVREAAVKDLKRLGRAAEPALRQALQSPRSAEAGRRLQALLEPLEDVSADPEALSALRAVWALEIIADAEAQTFLRALAQGHPAARLTQEAQTSLQRLHASKH